MSKKTDVLKRMAALADEYDRRGDYVKADAITKKMVKVANPVMNFLRGVGTSALKNWKPLAGGAALGAGALLGGQRLFGGGDPNSGGGGMDPLSPGGGSLTRLQEIDAQIAQLQAYKQMMLGPAGMQNLGPGGYAPYAPPPAGGNYAPAGYPTAPAGYPTAPAEPATSRSTSAPAYNVNDIVANVMQSDVPINQKWGGSGGILEQLNKAGASQGDMQRAFKNMQQYQGREKYNDYYFDPSSPRSVNRNK
jgi:hypothetical protein